MKNTLKRFLYWIYILCKGVPFRLLEFSGNIFPENSVGCTLRGRLYKPFLGKCGDNLQIGISVKLEGLKNLEFGKDVYIGHGSWINGCRGKIIFDDEVMLGPYVTMVGGDHGKVNGSYRFGEGTKKEIYIGTGTWLAAKVTVTGGVKIGKGVLCAANAVITKDVPDNCIVGGVPAAIIKKQN